MTTWKPISLLTATCLVAGSMASAQPPVPPATPPAAPPAMSSPALPPAPPAPPAAPAPLAMSSLELPLATLAAPATPQVAPRATVRPETEQPPPPPPPPPPPATLKVVKESVSQAAPKVVKGQPIPADAPPAPMIPPSKRGQLINVKVEFSITDQVGAKPPTRKTMTMTVADGEYSRIRTNADVYQKAVGRFNEVPLSVDVNPLVEGNKVRLSFSLEYSLLDSPPEEGSPGGKTSIAERLSVVLDNNVPVVVAQSTDPVTDRKVTVEVKATIVR